MPNNAIIEYNASIDLGNGELVRSLFENLSAHPTEGLFAGRVYWNTTESDLFIYTGSGWVQMGEMYIHPVFHDVAGINLDMSEPDGDNLGSKVLAGITINDEGHVTAASTRILRIGDLGYTGDLDANKYVHWKRTDAAGTIDINKNLSGNQVLDGLQVNSEGHVVDYTTRALTPADIGAAVINDSVINAVDTWSSQKIEQEIGNALTGALVHKGGYNPVTDDKGLVATPAGIKQGWTYVITTAGTFHGVELAVGDMIVAEKDAPGGTGTNDSNGDLQLNDWTVVNKNIPDIVDATDSERGIIRLATEAEVLTGINNDAAVTPATLVAFYDAQEAASGHTADIGDGVALSYDVSHPLATKLVQIEVYNKANGKTMMVPVERTTTGNVRIQVNNPIPAVSASSGYKVLIKKV
jgi:hypothetical protein